MIALRCPVDERSNVAMSVPVRAIFVFGSGAVADISAGGSIEAGSSARDGGASRGSKTGGAGDCGASTNCLFLRVRTLRTVGMGPGGCTGARVYVATLDGKKKATQSSSVHRLKFSVQFHTMLPNSGP
jgi:hypothetical protein